MANKEISSIKVGSTTYDASSYIYGVCSTASATATKEITMYYKSTNITSSFTDKTQFTPCCIPIYFTYDIIGSSSLKLSINGLSFTAERDYSSSNLTACNIKGNCFIPVHFYSSTYASFSFNVDHRLNSVSSNGINPTSKLSITYPTPKYLVTDCDLGVTSASVAKYANGTSYTKTFSLYTLTDAAQEDRYIPIAIVGWRSENEKMQVNDVCITGASSQSVTIRMQCTNQMNSSATFSAAKCQVLWRRDGV